MSNRLVVKITSKFKKDYKLAMKIGLDISLLETIIEKLANQEPLPPENRDHQLSGNLANFRECHILSDWLLVYRVEDNVLVLTFVRTGTHSDIF